MSYNNIIAQTTKHVVLNFNSIDFTYTFDKDSNLTIGSDVHDVFMRNDIDAFSLPFMDVNILIGGNQVCTSVTMNATWDTVLLGVNLAECPEIIPTDRMETSMRDIVDSSNIIIYPDTILEYNGTQSIGGYRMVNLCLSPFRFDASTKTLSLATQLDITIGVCEGQDDIGGECRLSSELRDDIKGMVVNPNEMDSLYFLPSTPKKIKRFTSTSNEGFDYVIITDSLLVPAFMPLVEWKNQKGIRTIIATTQQITRDYPDSLLQLKIKHYLKDCYENDSIQYALLGGDDNIIPAVFCDMTIISKRRIAYQTKMPVDLFYSCFGSPFNWNNNDDDKIGEISDSIDFIPEITLSRFPVRTTDDVLAIVNKIISYEKRPPVENWNNSILMGGCKLFVANDSIGVSDAEAIGAKVYNLYIKDYWQGDTVRFYDTITDLDGGASYDFNSTNLQSQLSRGYAFVDIITHGNYDFYYMEQSNDIYDTSIAATLLNSQPTILTTSACHTNGFAGKSHPCLSESLLRNGNSGIIAYLGCADKGFSPTCNVNDMSNVDISNSSHKFIGSFYANLFGNAKLKKNYGRIVDYTKYNTFKLSALKHNTFHRWIVFGNNTISDPEMPVYIAKPKRFQNVDFSIDNGYLYVNTNEDTCRICVSPKYNGTTYDYVVYDDTTSIIFDIGNLANVNVCITKEGYVPYIMVIKNGFLYIQDNTYEGNHLVSSDFIEMGGNVTDEISQGTVQIVNGLTIITCKEINIKNDFEVKKGANFIISHD